MHPPPIYDSIDPPFTHDTLYQFWVRSEGLWLSKLAKVTLRFLEEQELQTFRQHLVQYCNTSTVILVDLF
jgi:hypothetical protein